MIGAPRVPRTSALAVALRRLALGLVAAGTLAGCRAKEGERCLCADDCRGGLVCAADGAVLRNDQCVNTISQDIESGVCVDGTNIDDGDDQLNPPPRFDAGSWATDGEPPMTTVDPSMTETEGEATTDDMPTSSSTTDASSSSSTSAPTSTDGSGSDGSGSDDATGESPTTSTGA